MLLDGLVHKFQREGMEEEWRYRLLDCRCCGLAFVDPTPTAEIAGTFYDAGYASYSSVGLPPDEEARSAKYRLARMRFAGFNSRQPVAAAIRMGGAIVECLTGRTVTYPLGIPLQLPKQARILDVGYGSGGWLLAMAALGYENLHGYDIDPNVRNAERLERAGVTVTGGDFLANPYPSESFDCVRLEHAFEHVLQPADVLVKCFALLHRGGFIVMSFPCRDSWIMRFAMTRAPSLQLPKHLYLHTARSASLMLQHAGFELLGLRTFAVPAQLKQLVRELPHDAESSALAEAALTALAPLYRVTGPLTGKGDTITLLARRPP